MAEDFEVPRDTPSDSNSTSRSLVNEVNNDRQDFFKKSNDSQSSSSNAADAHFGVVELVDSSKDQVKAKDNANADDQGKAGLMDGMPPPVPKGPELPADQAQARKDAKDIYDACNWYNENDKVYKTLEGKSPEQLRMMDDEFKAAHGKSMRDYLEQEMKDDPDGLKKCRELLQPLANQQKADQRQLESDSDAIYKACGVTGNDNEAIYKALQGKNADQLKRMDDDFYAKHKVHISDYLNDEMKRHPEELAKAQGMLKPEEGTVDKDHPNVKKDAQGRITEFTDNSGDKYKFTYGSDGQPATMTIAHGDAPGTTYVPVKETEMVRGAQTQVTHWRNLDKGKDKIGSVSVDADTKEVTISNDGGNYTKLRADGSSTDNVDKVAKLSTPGSHISELHDTKTSDGKDIAHTTPVTGYELKDNSGHTTKVEVAADGKATITRQGGTEFFDKYEKEPNGDLKLTRANNSTLEIKSDGTMVSRDKNGHIVDTTSADGIKTEFGRDKKGNVVELTVTDGQGKVVEHQEKPKDLQVNDTDGSYTMKSADGSTIARKIDGSQDVTDKNGQHVESGGEKLLKDTPNLTPEQQKQLKADMGEIDKLPEEQRKKVYESLDKIAHSEAATKLTDQQRNELVTSLAHQIAHPESVHQGSKMTCALASAEANMARNHPDTYADMVSKLAVDGKYTTPGGKTVEAQMVDGHLAGDSDGSGRRNLSSEVFQNAAAQLAMADGDKYQSFMPGHRPLPPGASLSTDTGERVVHKDGSTSVFDGITADQEATVMNQLAPQDKYKATKPIDSQADLEKAMKDNGGLPMTVGVHVGSESKFLGMNDGDAAAGSGYHMVNITHYEAGPPAVVYFENTAGGDDHSYPNGKGVPVDDFVKAMKGGKVQMSAVVRENNHDATLATNPSATLATVH
jgi:YD repeat-containing protein